MRMQFNPKALLISFVFLVLLWFALTHEYGLIAVGLDALLSIGLWLFLPDDWPRRQRAQ